MLKNGELTQEDRDAFFDRMYAEGVMEVAADEYLQQARSEIAGRRIYVPESVKQSSETTGAISGRRRLQQALCW